MGEPDFELVRVEEARKRAASTAAGQPSQRGIARCRMEANATANRKTVSPICCTSSTPPHGKRTSAVVASADPVSGAKVADSSEPPITACTATYTPPPTSASAARWELLGAFTAAIRVRTTLANHRNAKAVKKRSWAAQNIRVLFWVTYSRISSGEAL